MNFDSMPWVGAEAEHNGSPTIMRFRVFPSGFLRWKYPCRLNIFWQMSDAENGLPTDDEIRRLETFEDHLVNAVEYDGHSVLVGVLTGNGEREFIFHTRDVPGFLERLTKMPQEEKRYPTEIYRNDDPEWSYFESVIPDGYPERGEERRVVIEGDQFSD